MLKLLRKKKVAKRIFYVLAVIIIPAFVIWGSASVINKNKTPNYAGIIFGKKVSFDEFREALSAWKAQMKLQFGDKVDQLAPSLFNPTQGAWDRLILLHEVQVKKIRISDEEVVSALSRIPVFQRNGNFDKQTYDLFLKYSAGEMPREFEEHLRQNLAMARIYDEATKTITLTDEEVKKEYRLQNEQTRVQYVFFPEHGYKDKITVTDDELKTAYENSKDKFKIPPQINAAYVGIELKDNMPESQKAEAAEKIKRALGIAKSKGLEEAAKELNLKIQETGLFGLDDPVGGFGWVPQLCGLLFDLPAQSFSKIVELKDGVYLFKIKEKKDAYLPDFKEAKNKVKETFLNEKSSSMARQKSQEFLALVKNQPSAFKTAAQEAGLQVRETPLFSREGYIPELGMAQKLKDAAFKLAKDTVFDGVIELEQGFCVIKSQETIPLDEEKFKKEKDEFAKQLLEQKRNKSFGDFFEELKKRAQLVNFISESTKIR